MTGDAERRATVLLDGFHAVKHALRFGADVRELLTADRAGTLALAADLAPDLPLDRLTEVPERTLRDLGARGDVVGVAVRPHLVRVGGPAVLLENPRNLGNVGAVVRVAAGLGAGAVLTTGTVDPWHPAVVRASAGLHWALPVQRVDAVPDGPLVAFDPAGTDLREVRLPDDAVLAFGSERHGLSAPVRDRADLVVSIPIRPGVSSYNLATSVSMGLYAWVAGRDRTDPARRGG